MHQRLKERLARIDYLLRRIEQQREQDNYFFKGFVTQIVPTIIKELETAMTLLREIEELAEVGD